MSPEADPGDDEMTTPKVIDYMTRDPIHLYVPGKRREAMKIFVNETISGIPVLREDDDRLVGIVTRADIFAKPHEDQLAMVMHKEVVWCRDTDPLVGAAKLMIDNCIHRLPVLNADDDLVGIISPLDILPYVEELDLATNVEEVMRTSVVPLHSGMPANVALEVMNLTGAKALPVLDDDAHVSGILTDRDIYAQVSIDLKIVESELGPETEEDPWSWDSLRNIMKFYYDIGKVEIPRIPIGDFMVKAPMSVQPKTSVSKASRLMNRGRFNQLPVMDLEGYLQGMVYDIDVLGVLL